MYAGVCRACKLFRPTWHCNDSWNCISRSRGNCRTRLAARPWNAAVFAPRKATARYASTAKRNAAPSARMRTWTFWDVKLRASILRYSRFKIFNTITIYKLDKSQKDPKKTKKVAIIKNSNCNLKWEIGNNSEN